MPDTALTYKAQQTLVESRFFSLNLSCPMLHSQSKPADMLPASDRPRKRWKTTRATKASFGQLFKSSENACRKQNSCSADLSRPMLYSQSKPADMLPASSQQRKR